MVKAHEHLLVYCRVGVILATVHFGVFHVAQMCAAICRSERACLRRKARCLQYTSRCHRTLNILECQVSKTVSSETYPRPTTGIYHLFWQNHLQKPGGGGPVYGHAASRDLAQYVQHRASLHHSHSLCCLPLRRLKTMPFASLQLGETACGNLERSSVRR